MSRILLANLGAPYLNEGTDKNNKEQYHEGYVPAKYCYKGNSYNGQYPFEALFELLNVDELVLFGTGGSEWDRLYDFVFNYKIKNEQEYCSIANPDAEFDKAYYEQLFNFRRDKELQKNMHRRDTANLLEKLRLSIKNCKKIIILHEGMTDTEWERNLSSLHLIHDVLEGNNNEVLIDLTLGYRSLPIYELLATMYFKNMYRDQISISGLYYAKKEKGKHEIPIVELDPALKLMDYTRVIHEYNRYGTVHSFEMNTDYRDAHGQLGDDIEALNKKANWVLSQLSNTLSFNDIERFTRLVKTCTEIINQSNDPNVPVELRLLSDHIFRDISKKFSEYLDDKCLLQYKLAQWHFDCKRFLVAITTAEECTISFAGEIAELPCEQYEDRRNISYKLSYINSGIDTDITKSLKSKFRSIRDLRNELAHPYGGSQNNQNLFLRMENALKNICDVYEKSFSKPNRDRQNRSELYSVLNQ